MYAAQTFLGGRGSDAGHDCTALRQMYRSTLDKKRNTAIRHSLSLSLFVSTSHLFVVGAAFCVQNCWQRVLGKRQDKSAPQTVIRAGVVPSLQHAAELDCTRGVEGVVTCRVRSTRGEGNAVVNVSVGFTCRRLFKVSIGFFSSGLRRRVW